MRDAAPEFPLRDIAPLIGLYGTDRPLLDIYERGGALFADGCGLSHAPVASVAEKLQLHREREIMAVVDGMRLEKRDFAGAAVTKFRRTIQDDLDRLRVGSQEVQPPAMPPSSATSDLVDIGAIDASIAIDMRYASTDNFMGVALYDLAVAFLQRPAAIALAQVQARLLARGYRLIVLDAYRPWSVTWMFWQAVPPESRQFVADPALGSKHNRGCAVDVTLVEIASGALVSMPSGYDEPSVRADPGYPGGTSRARWHRDLLRSEMERAGFTVDPYEWWHYDFGEWNAYPVLNTPLAALG